MKFKTFLQLLRPRKTGLTKLWEEAELARAKGDLAEEVSIYRRLIAGTPSNPDEFVYASLARYRLQEPLQAIELLEAGMDRYPGSELFPDPYLRISREQGCLSAAVQFVEAKLPSDTDIGSLFEKCRDVYVQEGLIEYCLSRGLGSQVESGLREILKSGWSTSNLWALGDTLLRHEFKDEARLLYGHLADQSAESADDYLYGGLAASRLGDPSAAVGILERGVEAHSADGRLAENYVRICCEIGAIDRLMRTLVPSADSEFQVCEFIFERFADTEIQTNLIAYCLTKGYAELADKWIRYSSEHFIHAEALWRLSDVLLQHHRSSEAEQIYEKLARQEIHDADGIIYAALALHRMNDAEKAFATLEAGLEKFPSDVRVLGHYVRIGSELCQVQRMAPFVAPGAQSVGEVCEVLFERFQDLQIQMNLIECCLRKGPIDLGESRLGKILANSSDPATLWRVAELLAALGRRDDAKKIYDELSRRDLESEADYFFAGLAQLGLENHEGCLQTLEAGQRKFPEASSFASLYLQVCAGRMAYARYSSFIQESGVPLTLVSKTEFYIEAARRAPVDFIVNLKELDLELDAGELERLKEEFLSSIKRAAPEFAIAKTLVFFSKYLDIDPAFTKRLFEILLNVPKASPGRKQAERQILHMLNDLTPPMIPHFAMNADGVLRDFLKRAEMLSESSIELDEPIADMSADWAPWQTIFCWTVPELYGPAIAALEKLAFKAWPKLDFIAPHVLAGERPVAEKKKIRVGFNVHDSMPMLSGFLPRLDKNRFETIFLRPGKKGNSQAAKNWVERANETVEYSDTNAYSAIETIAKLELDVIIAGPSTAAVFFPMMARLASLQLVLLEPNWSNGLTHADYYLSWEPAEPADPDRYYQTASAFFRHPPYWIERPALDVQWPISDRLRMDVRRRLLNCGAETRVYLCANTPPKIHPEMDGLLFDLLQRDPSALLVFLRADFPAAKTLKQRMRDRLGMHFNRVRFIPTLSQSDAHLLLQAVDCCIDSYPLCGMSSSFDAAMLGVPIVTLPAAIPFGRWTASIYEYIGVTGLIARDRSDYVDIAIKLASDAAWRREKGMEIREKSARYVENEASSAELEEFLLASWERKLAGKAPAHWMEGGWQQ